MRNFVQEGRTIPLPAPYAVASGAGMLVGSIFAVANSAAAQGEIVEADVQGVFDLLAEGAGSGQDIGFGGLVYWDDTAKRCTKTATNNTKIGAATEPKASSATTVRVRLSGAF
jgi:predicted RecA/RadA family phage recombinase